MISFEFTERDRQLIDEARRQAKLATKYARDFENAEDSLLPHAYPEADGCPDVRALLEAFVHETSGHKIIKALLYLEDWYGGVPLREHRYSLGNTVLKIAGTAEQYDRWHDWTIAIGLTEPVGGSDPASVRTTARFDPVTRNWIINGEKIFITYAEGCDAVLVLARALHPEQPQRLSTFIVEKGTPGFNVGPQIRKMGIRWEDTAALSFVDCQVPAFNHVDGDLKKTLQSFSESRPVVAAYALGVSRAALDYTWTQLRNAGIQPDYNARLATQPMASARMLSLEAEWEATWLTVVRAKWIEQREGPGKVDSSMAKAMGGMLARRVTQTCIEVLGAAGLSASEPLEKLFRDARIFDIYEGTGEIQRLIIARHILGYSPKELN
ncbi:acyl-CoA dehydrogenase family protein [Bradyrhizobium sp.]|uniref:acyl-CoA dehydrogenase family protein n=1 Tax=Bradyrhizobium sp. TaxID=376 RepID=UPI0039E6059C